MKFQILDYGCIIVEQDFFLKYEVSAVGCCCDGCAGDLMHGSGC